MDRALIGLFPDVFGLCGTWGPDPKCGDSKSLAKIDPQIPQFLGDIWARVLRATYLSTLENRCSACPNGGAESLETID